MAAKKADTYPWLLIAFVALALDYEFIAWVCFVIWLLED